MGRFKDDYESKIGYYDGKCATCKHYKIDDLSQAYNDGYKCEIYTHKRLAFDDYCNKYSKDYSRSQSDIKKAFDKLTGKYGRYNPHSYSFWHITTAVCEILGIDPTMYVNAGLKFIADDREANIREISYFGDYELNGITIADQIRNDEYKVQIAMELMDNYILPFYEAVTQDNIYLASVIYRNMYENLKEQYSKKEENLNK